MFSAYPVTDVVDVVSNEDIDKYFGALQVPGALTGDQAPAADAGAVLDRTAA